MQKKGEKRREESDAASQRPARASLSLPTPCLRLTHTGACASCDALWLVNTRTGRSNLHSIAPSCLAAVQATVALAPPSALSLVPGPMLPGAFPGVTSIHTCRGDVTRVGVMHVSMCIPRVSKDTYHYLELEDQSYTCHAATMDEYRSS